MSPTEVLLTRRAPEFLPQWPLQDAIIVAGDAKAAVHRGTFPAGGERRTSNTFPT